MRDKKRLERGEIATILAVGALVVLGITAIVTSFYVNKNKQTVKTEAGPASDANNNIKFHKCYDLNFANENDCNMFSLEKLNTDLIEEITDGYYSNVDITTDKCKREWNAADYDKTVCFNKVTQSREIQMFDEVGIRTNVGSSSIVYDKGCSQIKGHCFIERDSGLCEKFNGEIVQGKCFTTLYSQPCCVPPTAQAPASPQTPPATGAIFTCRSPNYSSDETNENINTCLSYGGKKGESLNGQFCCIMSAGSGSIDTTPPSDTKTTITNPPTCTGLSTRKSGLCLGNDATKYPTCLSRYMAGYIDDGSDCNDRSKCCVYRDYSEDQTSGGVPATEGKGAGSPAGGAETSGSASQYYNTFWYLYNNQCTPTSKFASKESCAAGDGNTSPEYRNTPCFESKDICENARWWYIANPAQKICLQVTDPFGVDDTEKKAQKACEDRLTSIKNNPNYSYIDTTCYSTKEACIIATQAKPQTFEPPADFTAVCSGSEIKLAWTSDPKIERYNAESYNIRSSPDLSIKGEPNTSFPKHNMTIIAQPGEKYEIQLIGIAGNKEVAKTKKIVQCPAQTSSTTCPDKSKGDTPTDNPPKCDGVIDIKDFSIWLQEFKGLKPKGDANFLGRTENGVPKVDLDDYFKWLEFARKELKKNK